MFKEEDDVSEGSISSGEVNDVEEVGEDDEDEGHEEIGVSSNNLRFYPYTNHKLTRSVGTLNLSLSSNVNLATPHHKKLGDIREEDPNERSVNEYINRWSPFNDCSPSTPVTLKRTASKSELSPFVNDPDILRKWRYKVSDSKSTKSSSPNQKDSVNVPSEVPDPAAFNAPTGLVSKMTKSLFVYPQRLSIPDTPVKKSPLLENSRLSNTMDDSPHHNITHETTLFQQSPSLKTIPQVTVDDSPLSAANLHNTTVYERASKVRYPVQFHVNRYKKIKKARNSVVLKNSELTNSLQEFTDDLYGTDSGYPEQSGDVTFLSNLPPPPFVGTCFFDGNSSSTDTTPTRRKSILGAHTRQQQPPQQPPQPQSSDKLQPTIPGRQGTGGSTESSPLQNRKHAILNPDSHLFVKFNNVTTLGDGQFSRVYQVTFAQTNQRYAVKAIQPNKHNCVKRILQEIKLLD